METEGSLPHSQQPVTRPYSEPNQSSLCPHLTTWRSILKLSFHLSRGLLSGLLTSGFPTKTLCTPLLFLTHAACSAHLILLDLITRTILGEEYRTLSFSLCWLYTPLLPCLSWSQISSSALYSQKPSAYVHTQRERPSFTSRQKTGKIIVLYILTFFFLDRKLEDNRFCTNR